MDVKTYLEIQELFRSKWDPAIHDVIAERPYRFLDLVRRTRTTVEGAMEQIAVSRALKRLKQAGLVRAAVDGTESQDFAVYVVTDKGHEALTAYNAIIVAYQQAGDARDRRGPRAPTTTDPPGR